MAEGRFHKRKKSRGLIEVIRSPAKANSNFPEAAIMVGVDAEQGLGFSVKSDLPGISADV